MQRKHNSLVGTIPFVGILLALFVSCPNPTQSPGGTASTKSITSFVFTAADNPSLTADVAGTIAEASHSISATLPATAVLTALKPTIAVSANATVSPASGAAADFTNAVTYRVTAQDGSAQDYTVTVGKIVAATPVIDKYFWGGWLGIGSDATWYISDSSVLVNGASQAVSSASTDSLVVATGSLEKSSQNLVKYTVSGSTIPQYLYRSRGATSSFNATVGQAPAARGLGGSRGLLTGISGLKVTIQNQNNPSNQEDLTTDASGAVTATDAVIGDNYTVTVPQQSGVASTVSAVVTPLYDGQDLGVMNILNSGANFKMNLTTSVRPELLYADATTDYPVMVSIANIGNADLDEANYKISSSDGLTLTGTTTDILGTVFKGSSKSVSLTVRCPLISVAYVDRHIDITVSNGAKTQSWSDSISVRFLQNRSTFSLNSSAQAGSLNGLIIDPDGIPLRVGNGATSLPWKIGQYTLAFGGSGTGSETKYSVGFDTAALYNWSSLTDTAVGEPNNDEASATMLGYGLTALQYLGAKDVDFYRLYLPNNAQGLFVNDKASGIYNNDFKVTLTVNAPSLELRYTTDGNDPTATTGTVYSTSIPITTTTTLKVAAFAGGILEGPVQSYVYTMVVATITNSLASGGFTNDQVLSLSTATTGATIRYTTDGTDPSATNGTAYSSGNVPIAANMTFKAIGVKSGYTSSGIDSKGYAFSVAPITNSLAAGSFNNDQILTLSTATTGATIRYTTDGTDPSSTNGTFYSSGNVAISANMTFKAIGVKTGYTSTGIDSKSYTFTVSPISNSLAAGGFNNDQVLTLSTATTGATIYYTIDGTDPSATNGTVYSSGNVSISANMTFKAIGVKAGYTSSGIDSKSYAFTVAPITNSLAAGGFNNDQVLTLSTATNGATIYYTTDGTDPSSTNGTAYSSGNVSISANMTFKAIGVNAGYTNSIIDNKSYTFTVPTPVFSPAGSCFTTNQSVTISCAKLSATIYYTTNGDTPTTGSTRYTATTISTIVNPATTIKAIAVDAGYSQSSVGIARYNFPTVGDTGPAGGLIFYDKGSYSDGWRFLEAAPSYQSTIIQWYNGSYIAISTGTAIGDGKANTDAIIAAQGNGSYAASLCKNFSLGSYSDWFLPSRDELNLMYTNLKQAGLGGFVGDTFWSSSQISNGGVWYQNFFNGSQYFDQTIGGSGYVRACRAF